MKTEEIKRLIALFVIFVLMTGLLTAGLTAVAKTDKISLNKKDVSNNIAFSAANMFPGDKVTKDFTVKVSHKKSISLFYRADIREGYEKLAEVLQINVYLPQKDLVLYDGLMRDMPNSLEYVLAEDEKEVVYRISAYLDTSVGNDYQNKRLIADFRWWYTEESDGGGGGDNDGGNNNGGDNDGGNDGGNNNGGNNNGGDNNGGNNNGGNNDGGNNNGGNNNGGNNNGGNNDGGDNDGGNNNGGDNNGGDNNGEQYPPNLASNSVKFVAEVISDGEYPRGSDFTFVLKDENGNVIQTVKNKDGVIEFDTLEFNKSGEYTYYIATLAGNAENIIYDDTVYKVTVKVDAESDRYITEVFYEKDGDPHHTLPRFVNNTKSYKPTEDVETDFPSNPKTGDDTEIMFYVYLLGASLMLIVLLLIALVRRREKKDEE